MNVDASIRSLAERQHGFVTRWDLRAAGLTRDAALHRIERGDFEVHGPRVLRVPGSPWSKASPLMRAVLDAGHGAFLSAPPAAAWWGLPGYDLLRIAVTRPRCATGMPVRFAHVVHEVVGMTTNQVTVLDGIPIVRPDRLAFELHAMHRPLRATRAVENMWSRNLVSGRSLRATFAELAGRGRKGTVAMREFLEHHPVDWVPPASGLEGRVMRGLKEEDLGEWRRQVDLGGTTWTGRVDFKHAELPLVIEVQSVRYHEALVDKAADAVRKAKLVADGFTVLEVWEDEVWYRFPEFAERVRTAVRVAKSAARRRQLAA